jgi:hypothetical protein
MISSRACLPVNRSPRQIRHVCTSLENHAPMTSTALYARVLAASAMLAASLLASTNSVQAETSSRRVRLACTGDAQRLCPREKKDSAEMRYCMEAKGRQLSRGCIKALEDDGVIPRGYFKS